ncbi:MAG: hypothetical protein HQL05_01745 [Nitrospirae bacterium]|uniref:hypothetical protein n=1 Tax=Candidatus Magnetobacterium casense TaxID=1455061 RepID=UPI0012DBE642|nr:hypothetical protein [Candidatus Magnetobacterium casensis]MBF0336532.1 hypothetical protein [Nitrospirota bacterium]
MPRYRVDLSDTKNQRYYGDEHGGALLKIPGRSEESGEHFINQIDSKQHSLTDIGIQPELYVRL